MKRWNRVLAILLAMVLVTTTFGSDVAKTVAFAVESGEDLAERENGIATADWEPIPEQEQVSEDQQEPEETQAPVEEAKEEAPSEEQTKAPDESSAEAAIESSAQAPAEESAEASSEASVDTPVQAPTEASTEGSSEAASEASSIDEAASEASSIDETASEASSEASSVEETKEAEKLVTVRYKATKGGRVSTSKETIDINNKEAAFEGATATAWNDKYTFVDWTDADGNQVCTDSTFVPSEIEEDAIFTANFVAVEDIEETMPAIVASNVHAGGMVVCVDAEAGLFPNGTEVVIKGISESQAIATAKETLGREVSKARGVDITFVYEGNEIQPADNKYVHVSLDLDNTMDAEKVTVLHDHDGSVDQIGADVNKDSNGNADSVSFDANQFSVFIVSEDNPDEHEKVIVTYKFEVYDSENSKWVAFGEEQRIKNGDKLRNPGTPTVDPDKFEEFIGWYTIDADGNLDQPVSFGETINDITKTEERIIRAKINTTYYVTFVGVEKDVVQVKKVPGVQGESAYTDVNVSYVVKDSMSAFKGWSTVADDESKIVTGQIDASDNNYRKLYAVVIKAFWIHFDENDDEYDADGNKISSGGASYTGPVAIEQTKTPRQGIGTIPSPTRPGYSFAKWYTGTKDDKNHVTLDQEFNWDVKLTKDVTLFATWTANATTKYTINIWMQNADDDGYSFDPEASGTYSGNTNAKLSDFKANGYKIEGKTQRQKYTTKTINNKHFVYKEAVVVDGNGRSTDVIGPKEDTVINVYYDRKVYNLYFQTKSGYNWKTIYTITAKYGQRIIDEFSNTKIKNKRWADQATGSDAFKYVLVVLDTMPDRDVTFHEDTKDAEQRTMIYMVQRVDGSKYQELQRVSPNYNFITKEEDFLELEGFTKEKSDPEFDEDGIIRAHTATFYYDRNKYPVTFMDNGSKVAADSVFDAIFYEKVLTEYKNTAPDMGEKDGKKFVCWCTDTAGTKPFDWSTKMPLGGITLYASYAPIRYKVTLDENGGTIDESKKSFKVDYGEKIEATNINQAVTRQDWDLVGWFYKDGPKAGQAYDFDQVTESSTEYVYSETDKCFYGTLNLKAEWRFPGLVKIEYNAGTNGHGAPTDDEYGYAYGSTVVVSRPSIPNTGWRFVGWEIENDTQSGRILYPNGSFQIENEFVQGTGTNAKVVLVAKYEKSGGPDDPSAKTVITYNSNDGNNKKKVVDKDKDGNDLHVNDEVKILTLEQAFGTGYKREGYKFVGWHNNPNATSSWTEAGEYYIAADNTPDAELDENGYAIGGNNLYAIWLPVYTVTYVDGVPEKEVFADQEYTVDGGEPTPAFVAADGTNIPKRPGYIFDGWDPAVAATVTEDITYTAKWKPSDEDYTVTYAKEGNGSVSPTEQKDQVLSNANITGSKATPDTGYKFVGWYKGETEIADKNTLDLSETVARKNLNKNTTTGLYEDTTYTAKFDVDEKQTYIVHYKANDDTMGSVSTKENKDIQVLGTEGVTGSTATAKNEGYEFEGWYVDGNPSAIISTELTLSEDTAKGNVIKDGNIYKETTFVAKFKVNDGKTYDVKYVPGVGGSVNPTINEKIQVLGTKGVTGSEATASVGYVFDKWLKDGVEIADTAILSDTKAIEKLNYNVTTKLYETTTYTATFKPDPSKTYTVTYVSEDTKKGTVTNAEDKDMQALGTDDIKGSAAQPETGYIFDGWYVSGKVATTETLSPEQVVTNLVKDGDGLYQSITFTAKFKPDPSKTYTVTYVSEDTKKGTVTRAEDKDIQALGTEGINGSIAKPEPGYVFDGWYRKDGVFVTDKESLTVEEIKTKLLTNGGLYIDTEFVAKFKPSEDEYTVTYVPNDSTMGSVTNSPQKDQVLSNTKITGSTATANTGYKFVAWKIGSVEIATDATLTNALLAPKLNKNITTKLYEDTEFTAVFEVDNSKNYDVKYISENESMGTVDHALDKDIQILGTSGVKGSTASAVNEGYKFIGWYVQGKPDTIISTEATLTAEKAAANVNKDTTTTPNTYKETTFVAKFDVNNDKLYNVTYVAQTGGSVDTSLNENIQVLKVDKVTGSTAKVDGGYKFLGWYKGDTQIADENTLSLSKEVAIANLNGDGTVHADTTYTAKFEIDESKKYVVTYKAEEGKGSVSKDKNENQALSTANITGSEATAGFGYEFDGWYVGETRVGTTANFDKTQVIAYLDAHKTSDGLYQDVEFLAKFKADNTKTYTVTYKAEANGTVSHEKDADIQVLSTTGVQGSTATAAKGYKFVGWYKTGETDPVSTNNTGILDASTAQANLNTVSAGVYKDTEYVAKFEIDKGQTYTVTYITDEHGTIDHDKNENIQVLVTDGVTGSTATPKLGYKVGGWYKDSETTPVVTTAALSETNAKANVNRVSVDPEVYGDTTFTVKYVPDEGQTYDVLYESENTAMGKVSRDKDAGIQILGTEGITGSTAVPETGYKLLGWFTEGGESVSTELILKKEAIEGKLNKSGDIYSTTKFIAKFVPDDSKTYNVTYIAETGGKVDTSSNTGIQALSTTGVTGSTATADKGYKFVGWYNESKEVTKDLQLTHDLAAAKLNKEGALYKDTTFTAKFEEDRTITESVTYTVNHVVDGETRATNTYTEQVWAGGSAKAEVKGDNIKPKTYDGYEFTKVVNHDTNATVAAGDMVEDKTVIDVLYEPKVVTIRYEYRAGSGVTDLSIFPKLPDSFTVKYGQEFDVIDVPKYSGYKFTAWAMEKDSSGGLTGFMDAIKTVIDVMTGTITSKAAGTKMTGPSYNAVIYTVVTKTTTPDNPDPVPDDPDPVPDNPDPIPTPITTPGQAVLGARREEPTNGQAVLGARRSRTEDTTNDTARVFAIIMSAAVAITLLLTGKKKKEDEEA